MRAEILPAALSEEILEMAKATHIDLSLTWTGRGKRPQWVTEYLAVEGRSIEDLAAE